MYATPREHETSQDGEITSFTLTLHPFVARTSYPLATKRSLSYTEQLMARLALEWPETAEKHVYNPNPCGAPQIITPRSQVRPNQIMGKSLGRTADVPQPSAPHAAHLQARGDPEASASTPPDAPAKPTTTPSRTPGRISEGEEHTHRTGDAASDHRANPKSIGFSRTRMGNRS